MEKDSITLFFTNTKEKLILTALSLDSLWRFRGLLEHTTRLQNSLKSRKLQRDNNLVMRLIEDYQTLSSKLYETLTDLLLVSDKLDDAQKNIKAHRLVNKLSRELEYIESLATSVLQNDNYYAKDQPDEFSWFDNVIRLAANDLDVDSSQLLVLFSLYQTIGLRSFTYTKEFHTLDLPVTILNTPWEWSVVWHEIAGLKVKEIKRRYPGIMKDTLEVIHSQVAVQSDWTEDYVEELFEDAGSILVFGKELIDIFESVLNRTYDQAGMLDSRHPDIKVRVNVASLLLGQDPPDATQDQRIVAKVIDEKLSEYLPSQKGKFDITDPHQIILDAIIAYKVSAAKGDTIFENAKSMLSNPEINIPILERTAKQRDLKSMQLPRQPDHVYLELEGSPIKLFNKFTTNENKISGILNLSLSESDFISPTDHSDDAAHSDKSVTIRFSTSHGDHKWSHKKN
jgi:hypothetical protein